jgi:hypothetical protein
LVFVRGADCVNDDGGKLRIAGSRAVFLFRVDVL